MVRIEESMGDESSSVPTELQQAIFMVLDAEAASRAAQEPALDARIAMLHRLRETLAAWRRGKVSTEEAVERLHRLLDQLS
jgi:hypothetical protein